MKLLSVTALAAVLSASASAAHRQTHSSAPTITEDSIRNAAPSGSTAWDRSVIVKAEILLDLQHFSPGQIDGKDGDNFRKALTAFQQVNKLGATGKINSDTWNKLGSNISEPVLASYTISPGDVAGPFVKQIPRSLDQMAELRGLSYSTPLEELAEKFHMSEDLLRALNPNARFDRAGEKIIVANVHPIELRQGHDDTVEALRPKKSDASGEHVSTIVVDKAASDVRAYDSNGNLVAFYPATVGSEEKTAPTGTFMVKRVAWNPDYHYDPKFAWKGVKAKHALTVKRGPNNPVGLVWIDLSAPSYGIHGTPEPNTIGKTESHGCVRLTNWDALNLAQMVKPGTVVKFQDQDSAVVPEAGRQGGTRETSR